MLKAWIPVYEDICREIERIRTKIQDLSFDNDFSSEDKLVKMRIHELRERIPLMVNTMKREAAAKREMIDCLMQDFYMHTEEIKLQLNDLSSLRLERSHANWKHVRELLRLRELEAEKGEEKEENNE